MRQKNRPIKSTKKELKKESQENVALKNENGQKTTKQVKKSEGMAIKNASENDKKIRR